MDHFPRHIVYNHRLSSCRINITGGRITRRLVHRLHLVCKLATALSVSSDTLVFDAERDPDEELRLQLEATQRLTNEDRELVKRFINGLLLSHEAKRLAA
jgi:hypothetical protein